VANILLKEVIKEMGLSGQALRNLKINEKIMSKYQRLIDKRFKDEKFKKQLKGFFA
jgi:hypothetical protein